MVHPGTTEGYTNLIGALTSVAMRRPQPARGLAAVMSSLLVAITFATPASAAIAPVEPEAAPVFSASSRQCTKWSSEYVPPKTIRVLRTYKTDAPAGIRGKVQKVDFEKYVATVMAVEWPEHYPLETLKAGAIATKQFAWYYILNPRGQTKKIDGKKVCYDVEDSTVDQYFKPEKYAPGKPKGPAPDSRIMAAIDATWDISLRKYRISDVASRMFLTGYRAGASKVKNEDGTYRPIRCGEDATGFKLFHNSTRQCGEDGLRYREILRRYLRPNLEIVDPGHGNTIGSAHGDASAMRIKPGLRIPHVWTPGRTQPDKTTKAGISISSDDLVYFASGDMNGDGRQDLVWLKKTGGRSGKIKVALSDGKNYRPGTDWWSGNTLVPVDGARLLVGDFYANQRQDVAILSRGDEAGTSRLVVLKRSGPGASEKLSDPEQWWAGSQDYGKIAGAWLGDLSGDGRADLIIRKDISGGGVALKTAVTKSPPGSGGQRMTSLQTRFEDGALKPSKVKMAVGDANRDGRADVIMLIGGAGSAKVVRLQGQTKGGFKRVKLWSAPKSDPILVRTSKIGLADIDYDGRSDLIVYSADDKGTRMQALKTRYTTMKPGPVWRTGADVSEMRPY